ncbi:bis(5'-nucleosyl)-tetraphosphatase PrpE [Calidifontibacillus erzurumensis]|uniref:Bis(5'-nucleosyl)-tetraphosphatase PrpE [asymmetrical] n=1 Tax=Calidifontibacillus erzurumensis TaxID=2741433 RepID=A0A8J8GDM3_9BACI|nr:bis(5'-nucleosyl)-tetraphosphatase PrpE [Calidifontibacillus erzurumensis]NSL51447.1 bis(5'-nucleosyl)-tetraphosphatase PrpE [Calidifontibacillus erzurumensis]
MLFDIIGDIHGCFQEFVELTKKLGYKWDEGFPVHPQKRKLVFVGDLTDRGPESIKMMEMVYTLVIEKNSAFYVPGNHCDKLYRFFLGRNVQIKHGLETTVAEYNNLSEKEKTKVRSHFMKLFEQAPLYLELDDGKLVVAHAGIRQDYIGKTGNKVKTFVLYGDITGETNPDGTPVRRDWAKHYKGDAWIVYGHTPVEKPRQINKTWNIDTGCVFGGMLTALRYPEMETVSVPSTMPKVPEKFRQFD